MAVAETGKTAAPGFRDTEGLIITDVSVRIERPVFCLYVDYQIALPLSNTQMEKVRLWVLNQHQRIMVPGILKTNVGERNIRG